MITQCSDDDDHARPVPPVHEHNSSSVTTAPSSSRHCRRALSLLPASFALPPARISIQKCILNTLVIDIEIANSTFVRNVYLSEEVIKGETDREIGVKSDIARNMTRTIDLDVDIGADAMEMRKLEGLIKEIVDELDYLMKRQEKIATTNFSTNQRVQRFTLLSLMGLGACEIFHLRAFFKPKYLID